MAGVRRGDRLEHLGVGAGVVVGGEVALRDGGPARVAHGYSGRRLPFIFRAASEQRNSSAVGDLLGGGEGAERLVGVVGAHLRGQDRVDDEDVRGRRRAGLAEACRRAPGSTTRPPPWSRRRRRWCPPAPGPGRRRRGRSARARSRRADRRRRGWCGSPCARAGRAATRSPRAAWSPAARPPSSRRPGAGGRRRGRSARRASRPTRARRLSSSRSTTRASIAVGVEAEVGDERRRGAPGRGR